MRLLAAGLLVAALLAGCFSAEPGPEREPRTISLFEMHVEVRGNSSFRLGSILGSPDGALVAPFAIDEENRTLAADVPAGAEHAIVLHPNDGGVQLVANVTRAGVDTGDPERPVFLSFEREGDVWTGQIVQPFDCTAIVNDGGNVVNGTGPFTLPPLAPGDWVVLVLEGEEPGCARMRLQMKPLGSYAVAPPE